MSRTWRPASALVVGRGPPCARLAAGLQARDVRSFLCGDRQRGARLLRAIRPALLVAGPCPEGRDAWALLAEASRTCPETVRLLLLEAGGPERAMRAIEAGADDVVVSPGSPSSVLLRAALARARREDQHAVPRGEEVSPGSLRVDPWSRTLVGSTRTVLLSAREAELLHVLQEAEGRVVRRDTLLRRIWQGRTGADVLYATVSRLRRRLVDAGMDARVVDSVPGVGYRLGDAGEAGRA